MGLTAASPLALSALPSAAAAAAAAAADDDDAVPAAAPLEGGMRGKEAKGLGTGGGSSTFCTCKEGGTN